MVAVAVTKVLAALRLVNEERRLDRLVVLLRLATIDSYIESEKTNKFEYIIILRENASLSSMLSWNLSLKEFHFL